MFKSEVVKSNRDEFIRCEMKEWNYSCSFTTYFVFHNAQNMPFEWLIKICDNNTNTVSFSVRFNKMISHLISDLFFILANKKN